jgi:hypothetical protein
VSFVFPSNLQTLKLILGFVVCELLMCLVPYSGPQTKLIVDFAVCELLMSYCLNLLSLPLQAVSCCGYYFISRLLIKPPLSLDSKSLLSLAVLGLLTKLGLTAESE